MTRRTLVVGLVLALLLAAVILNRQAAADVPLIIIPTVTEDNSPAVAWVALLAGSVVAPIEVTGTDARGRLTAIVRTDLVPPFSVHVYGVDDQARSGALSNRVLVWSRGCRLDLDEDGAVGLSDLGTCLDSALGSEVCR